MRILIVEDNAELSRLIADGLRAADHPCDAVANLSDADVALRTAQYSAVILDRGLPDGDGLDLLRRMRGRGDATPTLVLTARDGVHDRVDGLRGGADDYLVKPFAFEELVARIQALLRRPQQLLGARLTLADLSFDTVERQAFVNNRPVAISAREAAVLDILMRRGGKVAPKRMIEDQLFGLGGDLSSNAVEVYVHRLRKQLSDAGSRAQIHTIRGVGYMIAEARTPSPASAPSPTGPDGDAAG